MDESGFAEVFRAASAGMLLLDDDGIVVAANPAALRICGLTEDDVLGRAFPGLLHLEDRPLVRAWLTRAVPDSLDAHAERRLLGADDTTVWARVSLARLTGADASSVVTLVDISEWRATEARLAHQALHDPLTGLPNRILLFDRLAQAVRAAQREGAGVTVLYLDVDGFKAINDTRGHTAGDRVLIEVADRLGRVLRTADTVARLGGDEFAVVAEGLSAAAADELTERVIESVSEPVAGIPIAVSVGMAHSDTVPLDVDALISAADAAMYRAKQQAAGPTS